ncbi:hypothetical protein K8Q94_03455 [Candidatus Nomurabacteria bacterium]|nr:hypothetical protein [Candidatus Nomurabacteria bacterium]
MAMWLFCKLKKENMKNIVLFILVIIAFAFGLECFGQGSPFLPYKKYKAPYSKEEVVSIYEMKVSYLEKLSLRIQETAEKDGWVSEIKKNWEVEKVTPRIALYFLNRMYEGTEGWSAGVYEIDDVQKNGFGFIKRDSYSSNEAVLFLDITKILNLDKQYPVRSLVCLVCGNTKQGFKNNETVLEKLFSPKEECKPVIVYREVFIHDTVYAPGGELPQGEQSYQFFASNVVQTKPMEIPSVCQKVVSGYQNCSPSGYNPIPTPGYYYAYGYNPWIMFAGYNLPVAYGYSHNCGNLNYQHNISGYGNNHGCYGNVSGYGNNPGGWYGLPGYGSMGNYQGNVGGYGNNPGGSYQIGGYGITPAGSKDFSGYGVNPGGQYVLPGSSNFSGYGSSPTGYGRH